MNINSYALALTGDATKSGRKASEISESPARPGVMETDDWPAIATGTTPGSQSERSQGNAKKGKLASSVGLQSKLNAFFALANAAGKKTNAPPPQSGVRPGGGNDGLARTRKTYRDTFVPP